MDNVHCVPVINNQFFMVSVWIVCCILPNAFGLIFVQSIAIQIVVLLVKVNEQWRPFSLSSFVQRRSDVKKSIMWLLQSCFLPLTSIKDLAHLWDFKVEQDIGRWGHQDTSGKASIPEWGVGGGNSTCFGTKVLTSQKGRCLKHFKVCCVVLFSSI